MGRNSKYLNYTNVLKIYPHGDANQILIPPNP
jgi:hypothetical protein